MTNRLIISIAFLTLLFADNVHAQDINKVELSAGAGVWTSDELFDGYSPGFLLGVTLKTYTVSQYSGTFFFAAKYFVAKHFSLSIAFAYENESGGWQNNINTGNRNDWQTVQLGTFKRQAFTFAPEACVYYINSDMVRFYATFGLGATYRNEVDRYSDSYYQSYYYNGVNSLGTALEFDNNKTRLNVYLSPVGLSIGQRIRWFGEMGIGYKGIFNTGLSIKI